VHTERFVCLRPISKMHSYLKKNKDAGLLRTRKTIENGVVYEFPVRNGQCEFLPNRRHFIVCSWRSSSGPSSFPPDLTSRDLFVLFFSRTYVRNKVFASQLPKDVSGAELETIAVNDVTQDRYPPPTVPPPCYWTNLKSKFRVFILSLF